MHVLFFVVLFLSKINAFILKTTLEVVERSHMKKNMVREDNYELFYESFQKIFCSSKTTLPQIPLVEKEPSPAIISTNEDNDLDDAEIDEYFSRGERIETLARAEFDALLNAYSAKEKLYSIKLPDKNFLAVVDKVANAVVRPLLANVSNENDEFFKSIRDMISPNYDLKIRIIENGLITAKTIHGKMVDDTVMCLTIREKGKPEITMYGTKSKHPLKTACCITRRTGLAICDIARILAVLIMLTEVAQYINQKKAENDAMLELRSICCNFNKQYIANYSLPKVYSGRNDPLSCKIYAPMELEIPKSLIEALEKRGKRIVVLPNMKECQKARRLDEEHSVVLTNLYACQFLKSFVFMDSLKLSYYEDFSHIDEGYAGPIFKNNTAPSWQNVFTKIFLHVFTERAGILQELKELKRDSEGISHARSYEDKKNLTKTTLRAMSASSWNQSFGFVEFDNDVDVVKAEALAQEFHAIKKEYFPFLEEKDHALRFRRLGHHKANGIYFYIAKSLCVDLFSPKSLMHEYGHLLDYRFACSKSSSFKPIIRLYEEYLQSISECAALKAEKGKYGYNYYTKPTEVFARSFELYLSKCKNIKTSLLPDEFSFVYPQNETFEEHIRFYFDTFFAELANNMKEVAG